MASGTPVVASKTGGLQYTVRNKKTGFLAQPRNPSDLALQIIKALSKGKSFFSKNSSERIEKNFRWEKIAKEFKKYFEQLSKRKRKYA